jgi:hypothetical protein
MKPPKGVQQIIPTLAVNSIGLILGGLLLLLLGHSGGAIVLLFGIPLGIVTYGFYNLERWTYPIVKALVTGPFRLKGAVGFKKAITDPEVMRAFGLTPNGKQQYDDSRQDS